MQYLGLALYAEGASDDQFLCPLLLRLCQRVCSDRATQKVEIGDVMALDDLPKDREKTRGERIALAARRAAPAWNILFIHADADRDADAARAQRVQPGATQLCIAAIPRTESVAVVPVRSTEAWTLSDGDALRSVTGTRLDDRSLGLNVHGPALERVTDPKQLLRSVIARARPLATRRGGLDAGRYLNALGEQVDLVRLQSLPSFARTVADLQAALQKLQVIR